MLTPEGKVTASECLVRSGMEKPVGKTSHSTGLSGNGDNISHQELAHHDSATVATLVSTNLSPKEKSFDIPQEYLDKVYIHLAFNF